MAEPARNANQQGGELDLRERAPENKGPVSQKTSDTLNLIPFAGGAKQLGESLKGQDLSGAKLSGGERIKRAATGAVSLGLDFTGVGEAEKGAVALGREAGLGKKAAGGVGNVRRFSPQGAPRGNEIREGASPYSRGHASPQDLRSQEQQLARQRTDFDRAADAGRERAERSKRNEDKEQQKAAKEKQALAEETAAARQNISLASQEADPARAQAMIRNAIRSTIEQIQNDFKAAGYVYKDEYLADIARHTPTKPSFPFIMLCIGATKDAFDFFDLTLVGVAAVAIITAIVDTIIGFWHDYKSHKWYMKKIHQRKMAAAFFLGGLLEATPFFQMLPGTMIFILRYHYEEAKVVKLINRAHQRLEESGILPYIST